MLHWSILDKAGNCWCGRRRRRSRQDIMPAAASLRHATTSRGRADVALITTDKQAGSIPELEIHNLVKRYTAQSVIGPISLSVAAGEFVSLLGPSGCGKTTTLRCIAGFETPSEGSILLSGTSIERQPPNRRNIGLVFQNYALFPHLTIFENVAFGLRLRRIDDAEVMQRVGQALELVGLPDLGERYRRQLQGGQQQRIAIARSVVIGPR